MDFTSQIKLSKSEWESIEKTVSNEELEILQLIIDGYENPNIKINKNKSFIQLLKISFLSTEKNELNLPLQATANWSSSTLCSGENINKQHSKEICNKIQEFDIFIFHEFFKKIIDNFFLNLSTINSEKFIFGSGDASAKNVNNPSKRCVEKDPFSVSCEGKSKNKTKKISSASTIKNEKIDYFYTAIKEWILENVPKSNSIKIKKADLIRIEQLSKNINKKTEDFFSINEKDFSSTNCFDGNTVSSHLGSFSSSISLSKILTSENVFTKDLPFEYILLKIIQKYIYYSLHLPSQATVNGSSSTLRSEKFLNNTSYGENHKDVFLYTIIQLKKNSIPYVNQYIVSFIDFLIIGGGIYGAKKDFFGLQSKKIENVIYNAYQYIEKNEYLLKYEDLSLFSHQKQLFSIFSQQATKNGFSSTVSFEESNNFSTFPSNATEIKNSLERSVSREGKLVLYTAPTGTGKTLSPIGLSQQYKIIFVCVARHVGLALAKSAISIGKKVAFAFGCETANDIRLHYFSAVSYTINKKSGGIGKVDNTCGENVEIMICDVKSYLVAMYYMLAFNSEHNIITYWDEPTITMDYKNHPLHEIIHRNWVENQISKVVLSSATLPDQNEIYQTITDFQLKFENSNVYHISSYDCKKSIQIINKECEPVLPHLLFKDRNTLLKSIKHCENNKTLLRYFDLNEVVKCIKSILNNSLKSHKIALECEGENELCGNKVEAKMNFLECNVEKLDERFLPEAYFENLTNVTMESVKLYYLFLLKHYFSPQDTENGDTLRSSENVNFSTLHSEKFIFVSGDASTKNVNLPLQATANWSSSTLRPEESLKSLKISPYKGVLLTTSDAHTLTDGPTIYIVEDVDKIADFYIRQTKIPSSVMEEIIKTLNENEKYFYKISLLEKNMEDALGKDATKENKMSKIEKGDVLGFQNKDISKLKIEMENINSLIKIVNLNAKYIPNTKQHQHLWAPVENNAAFSPYIEESIVKKIMALDFSPPATENGSFSTISSGENTRTETAIKVLTEEFLNMKILLLLGIGVFTNKVQNVQYMEIMKQLASEQKLYLILAQSDYIYGTNYQFCHAFIGKDLTENMTTQKIIQAMGRVGRGKLQQDYSIRFRDNSLLKKLFLPAQDNMEAKNMNRLFSS